MQDFEHVLLKSLIYNKEFFSRITSILQTKHFSSIGNAEVFKIMKNYYAQYKKPPSTEEIILNVRDLPSAELRTNVINELKQLSNITVIDNVDFLLEKTVDFIKDSMYFEAIQLGADALTKKDKNLELKAKKIMDDRSKITIDSDLGLDWSNIEAMIEYYQQRLAGIQTQHDSINKRLGAGFLPGTLSLILAPSGVGKSLLMTDLLTGMLLQGKNILLISMEMADREIMKRVHANALDLPINDLRKILPEVIKQKHNELNGKVGNFFVKDYAPGTFSPLMLETLLDSYKNERDVEFDIVFLDYLGIMKSDLVSPGVGLYSYIKSIAEETRAVAVNRKIPIISASQLNRSATGNKDFASADNSSVSDSIGTVQTADFMLFLLQNEQMKSEGIIQCKITKNRFTGMTDSWTMNIDYTRMRFADVVMENLLSDQEVANIILDDAKNNAISANSIKAQSKQTDDFDVFDALGLV